MAEPDIPRLNAREAAALDEAAAQRARAEAAEAEAERLRRANKTIIGENHNVRAQLGHVRDAVRVGDWDAMWTALDIPATERLPAMPAPLYTAPGELELTTAGLDADQEIRAWALDAAARIGAGIDAPTVRDLEQTIIGTAERYADWIATGSTEAWDWHPAKSRGGPTTVEAGDA